MRSANDKQVAGKHYKAKIQHWDYVISALDSRYLEGNITKYVCRHRKKNGVQDLEKALHYLEKLREEFTNRNIRPLDYLPRNGSFPFAEFVAANGLNTYETSICRRIAYWYRLDHLDAVRDEILQLIEQAHQRQRESDAEKCGFPGKGYINQG